MSEGEDGRTWIEGEKKEMRTGCEGDEMEVEWEVNELFNTSPQPRESSNREQLSSRERGATPLVKRKTYDDWQRTALHVPGRHRRRFKPIRLRGPNLAGGEASS